jgi:hypothetical protein
MKWERQTNFWTTNYVLEGDGFALSYNPSPGGGMSAFQADGGDCETAIVADGEYYILNGDWRKEYEKLAPEGLDACMAFYEAHRGKHGSSWSTGGRVTAQTEAKERKLD